ncbi:transcriptional regulator, LysR family [Campylobacter iguaniorum]|uniref:LysR family transcriptional regulator n=1 Tax=Campylobacter iguaniorum TaxID=1244531 RepID=UPI0007C9959F|nr:LysR family transcriptional regulator [Campylobacter iguaniorum]ANE35775.1 transcriptional regulator, LysR family [Campylobacter iguaniorum]
MVSDFNKIYTFMAIVRERSFSKASKVLGVSQPAVTLQIKKLEETLQATLIMRKKNGIILTKEGEKFYKLCLKFEGSMFRFKEQASHIKDEKTPMVVATNSLIGDTILPMMLDKICDAVDSNLNVKITDNNNLLLYLLDRRCDFCLMGERIYNDQLVFKKLLEYEIVLVANHEFTGSLNANDLEKHRFIKDKTKNFINSYFDQFGINYDDLNTAYSLDGSVAVKAAILNNKTREYLAFLPKFMIEEELKNGQIFLIELENIKIIRTLYVASLNENEEIVDRIGSIELNLFS